MDAGGAMARVRPRTAAAGALLAMLLAALVAGLGACTAAGPELTGRFQGNGVTVTVRLLPAEDGPARLAATFHPDRTGLHLYSLDLPPGGVDGLGVPTRLTPRGQLRAAGEPTADRPVRTLRPDGLDVDLPVYPDGPVTVTLPVEGDASEHAEVAVTYGACGTNRCLMPVIDQVIALRPGGDAGR